MKRRGRALRTVVRDCLYLNWAFPLVALPALPGPLRYEEHVAEGKIYAFGSALLFRHQRLHLIGLPFLSVSYPQFHLRLYVRDHEDVPSVFFQSVLVPSWVVPSARWFAHQPAVAGQFRYPTPSAEPQSEQWGWEVRRGSTLRLVARSGAPCLGPGPLLGSWDQMVTYFRHRERGYVLSPGGLRQVETTQRRVPLVPVVADLEEGGLLSNCLPLAAGAHWPEVHSAWLCPEIPFVFEVSPDPVGASLRRSAGPVAPDPAMFEASGASTRRSAA